MTTATPQSIIDRAKDFGIEANFWAKAGKSRIYAKTDRRDMAVFLQLEDEDGNPVLGAGDVVHGAALKVFCSTSQHPNWVSSQCQIYRKKYVGLFYAYIIEVYGVSGEISPHYGPDIRAMIEEARAAYEAVDKKEEAA